MGPAEVLRRASSYLERHGVEDADATAERLMMHVLGTDRAGLYARSTGLDAGEARRFGRALCRRCAGTPVQHLTGEQAFRRIVVGVRPGVFVPRPETEVLVEHALAAIRGTPEPLVVDVGTGTGAIALAVADERRDATVVAIDRAPRAVELARENAHRLGLDLVVLEGDLLEPLADAQRGAVDLVVANPPYVAREDLPALAPHVLADPELALVGDLDLYRRLTQQAVDALRPGGALVLEIDASRAADVAGVVPDGFEDVRIEPDLTGRDRVIVARRR